MPQLRIHLFAAAKHLAGRGEWLLDTDERSVLTVVQLKARLARECPALEPLLARTKIAIDGEYADDDAIIPDDAELALIPPVSGG